MYFGLFSILSSGLDPIFKKDSEFDPGCHINLYQFASTFGPLVVVVGSGMHSVMGLDVIIGIRALLG